MKYYVVWDTGQWGPYSDRQLAENARDLAQQLRYPNPRVEEREK